LALATEIACLPACGKKTGDQPQLTFGVAKPAAKILQAQ
jgi:hypothetical protein